MSYTDADARRQLLDELARALDQLAVAVTALGEAYEQMDERSADRLEDELFKPLQAAYGLGKRTHAEFGARHGFPARTFEQASPGLPTDSRHLIEHAADALRGADETLATLQDSMLPVEVGDQELRAGMSHVRELIGPLPGRARELVRGLGR